MSEIKVDTVKGRDGQVLLGDSGDTITVPSGATFTTTDATLNTDTLTATTESKTNKISPASGTAFTFGDSGDTFTVPAGATMANSGTASGFGAGPVLIQSQTGSGVSEIAFTTGIDSTYDEYMFVYINIKIPDSENSYKFAFNTSTDGGSSYNNTKTTSVFESIHTEGDTTYFQYNTGYDHAQSTDYQALGPNQEDDDTDSSTSGILHLFAPSSTTYVKHFYSRSHTMNGESGGAAATWFVGGYMNTTSAINAVSFKNTVTGTFSGTIKLYGVS